MELLAAFLLILLVFMWFRLNTANKSNLNLRKKIVGVQELTLRKTEKIIEASTLNTEEVRELMMENFTSVNISSNIWNVDLPYGKWVEFNEIPNTPSPEIRGFWLNAPGKVIGVKMPVGSRYEKHRHPYVEILVGLSGSVTVEITLDDGTVEYHELSKDSVVIIPSNIDHAVLTTKQASKFVCIWGQPN